MIRALLTDLDNTVLDFISFKEGTGIAAARALGDLGAPGGARMAYQRIFRVYEEMGMEGEKTYFGVVSSYGLSDLNMAERLQQAAIIAHQQAMPSSLWAYPMVKETLEALRGRGIRMGAVSDGPRNKAWKRLVLAGLDRSYDLVVTHDDTGKYKPEIEPFMMALKTLGLGPSECLYIGDNPARDMAGARMVGMGSILALYGAQGALPYDKRGEYQDLGKPDHKVERFEELLDIIGRINKDPELIGKRKGLLWRLRSAKEHGKAALRKARLDASKAALRG